LFLLNDADSRLTSSKENHMTGNEQAPETPTALVIGATGGIGGAVTKTLMDRGWRVKALTRRAPAERPKAQTAVDWIVGDAMNDTDVIAAAQGVQVIFHGANPPRYHNWRGLALPMLRHSIAAAKASGARLILPGNVYNFGPDAGDIVAETAPQHPLTRKGRVRVEMEQTLADAARDGVRSLVVRAGDFFGGASGSSWFEIAFAKPDKPVGTIRYPGRPEIGHSWAYLPDLASTIVQLAERDAELAPFEIVHFEGHWVERGIEMAEAVRRAAGLDRPILRFPWFAVYLAAPFVPLMREVLEMRYLWQRPLRLDNRKLVALLGREPHTPLDMAVRRSLVAMGCLPETAAAPKHDIVEADGFSRSSPALLPLRPSGGKGETASMILHHENLSSPLCPRGAERDSD
jgi:nucleoside-diphosphate-sugar epimerase